MATNRRDLTDRERLRDLEGGGAGGGGGGFRLPSWMQEPGRFGPTTIRPSLNQPARGDLPYRSPSQSHGFSLLAHPLENAVRSQRADIGRMARGVTTPAASKRGQAAQRAAGLRGLSRTGSRAAYFVGAEQLGEAAGEYADEKLTNAEKRKLAAAKADMEAAESQVDQEVDTSGANPDAVRGEQYGRGAPDGMKRGGRVKKMASGGMTSKASGASKRADGIAQRGKTKGRFV